jgi:hypothetical protein
MIRLIASLALAAFLAAPALAQDDELPPLPTRAEVLAEIEAALALEDRETRGYSIEDMLSEWHGFFEMQEYSLRLAHIRLADFRGILGEDDVIGALDFATSLPGAFYDIGDRQLARDVILELEQVLLATISESDELAVVDVADTWQSLYWAAAGAEQEDLAQRYISEYLRLSHALPLDQRLDAMDSNVYEQIFQRNSGAAYQQIIEAINLILGEPSLSPFSGGHSRRLSAFVENAALIESPDDLALLQQWAAISEELGQDPADIYMQAAQWYMTAEFGPQARMAAELGIRAMLLRPDSRDRLQLYRAAQILADQHECGLALGALEWADVLTEISEIEWRQSRLRLEAERRTAQHNKSQSEDDDGDRIVISGGHYILPSRLPTGQRFLILARCRTLYEAAGALLDDLTESRHSIADFGQDMERQFETQAERLAVREALGRQIRPDDLMQRYIDSETVGSRAAVSDMAYISMALRAAGRTQEADRWLERAWAEFQAYEGGDRHSLLARIAIALPE